MQRIEAIVWEFQFLIMWETKGKRRLGYILIIPTCLIGGLHNLHNLVVKADFLLSKLTKQPDDFAGVAWNCWFLNWRRKFEAFNFLELCLSQPLSIRGWFTELKSQLRREIPSVSTTGTEVSPHYLTTDSPSSNSHMDISSPKGTWEAEGPVILEVYGAKGCSTSWRRVNTNAVECLTQ